MANTALRMYCIDTEALVFMFNGGSPYSFTIHQMFTRICPCRNPSSIEYSASSPRSAIGYTNFGTSRIPSIYQPDNYDFQNAKWPDKVSVMTTIHRYQQWDCRKMNNTWEYDISLVHLMAFWTAVQLCLPIYSKMESTKQVHHQCRTFWVEPC